MFKIFLAIFTLSVCSARPNKNLPQNVITVPPNCPVGQEWINGACRDIWRSDVPIIPQMDDDSGSDTNNLQILNMVTVPPNCRPGQQWINGQCRDIWRGGVLADSELFKKLIENLWTKIGEVQNFRPTEDNLNDYTIPAIKIEETSSRNIISVPNQCPEGYKRDALGICRKELL